MSVVKEKDPTAADWAQPRSLQKQCPCCSPHGGEQRDGHGHQPLNGLRSGPLHGRGPPQGFHEPAAVDVGCAALRISVVDGPLTRPPPAEGSYTEPSHGPFVPQSPPAAVLLGAA
jgi:hypothetical protein